MSTRRDFLAASTATLLAQALPPAPTTRPNIAAIDHDRILAAARIPAPLPTTRQEAGSREFLAFAGSVAALAAATQIDPAEAHYIGLAEAQLKAWFLTGATRLPTSPGYKDFEQIVSLAALAEIAIALPFLRLDPDLLTQLQEWFASYLTWLTEDRTALLARDARNHHASSWLLQASAIARLTGNEAVTTENRHRYKTSTIRAQINADGLFPRDVTSPNPFRDSLFNLDLLAGVCVLLSTRFENVWDYELQDGPGMRAVIARHAMYIATPVKWPYPADASHFSLLPCRRPALVFAGRAYSEADYVTLWRTLTPAEPSDPDLLRAFPIRQPLLWLTQPRS